MNKVSRLNPGWNRYDPLSLCSEPVLIGIGQRYHVVVEARPSNDLIPVEEQNYWIRITGADGCFSIEPGQKGNDKLGIVRYNRGNTATPTSKAYGFNKTCADEPYESLVPVVPWEVDARDHPANSGMLRSPTYPQPTAFLLMTLPYSRPGLWRQL